MKLLLNPKAEAQWFDEPQTGARFLVRAINPETYENLRRKSNGADGKFSAAKWGQNFAEAAIEDWDGVGDGDTPAECTAANRRVFGKHQAFNMIPWIVDRATSLDRYRAEEEEAAKKD